MLRFTALALVLVLPACFDRDASGVELRDALDEVVLEGQGQAVENEIIEITTDFTLGAAAEAAAGQLRDVIASQIPCSELTLAGDTLTIDFGTLEDACVHNGHTFAGIVTVTITRDDAGNKAIVDHTYDGLTNGVITLDGTKVVTWDEASRHVVTDLEIARGDRTVHATSDRVQTLLDPAAGLAGGIEINGERHWDNVKGAWDLTIDGVELRWVDPVPQAGAYTLVTPKDRTIVMSFARVDDDTIAVTLTGGRRDRVFHVSTDSGSVADLGDA